MATLAICVQNIGIAFLTLIALSSIAVHSDVVKEYNAAEGQIVCYECYNIVDGVYQPHCPKNGSVGPWTWKINCTGKCYTRTDDQNTDLIYRGCTDNQPFLPDPLPKDGCYPFYLETWCICSKNGCNGHAMGKPGKLELDAHLPKTTIGVYNTGSSLTNNNWIYFFTLLNLFIFLVEMLSLN